MTECPELDALEVTPLPPELREHVSGCNSCKLVVEVFDAASSGRIDFSVNDCITFDSLLAARSDGTLGRAGKNLLDRHLASCSACREVAETLSPTQDADGDHQTLPEVDPTSYEIGLEVARGGMGRVVAARDLRIGRPIAIKELLGRSPQLAARFEREARVTARLQHPGIVPIYEIGTWPDGTPFYSMRMVDGGMLLDEIANAKTLAARLALLPAVIAATEAVAFAHAKRVIHRDLTPANILVGRYGETVVIDWGLAKDLAAGATDEYDPDETTAEAGNDRLTGVGAVIGTATYMPPEQAHAIPVDERADVYALGAILYHVLAGTPPYKAKSAKELLRAVKTAPPEPIEKVQPATPRDLVSIVSKAMARDPEARYPSARELAEELKRFQTGRLVEAHAYSRWELMKRFLRRHRAVVTVMTFALTISAVLGAIAVRRIVTESKRATTTAHELMVESGRIELLAGNTQQALAYLNKAYQTDPDSPTLKFLLGSALGSLSKSERTLDCGGDPRWLAFDREKKYVAAGCRDLSKVWRLDTGDPVARLETGDIGYNYVLFSNNGLLATWGKSGWLRIWNPATGEKIAALLHGDDVEITRAAFTPDGKQIVSLGYDGLAHLWDIASQTKVRTIVGSTGPVRNLYGNLGPDGRTLYTVTLKGIAKRWDLKTGEQTGTRTHGSSAIGGDLSRDGLFAVTCGTDRRVRVWDTSSGNQVHQFAGHTDTVWKCLFSPDGKYVLSGGHDGTANIWDLADGKLAQSVQHGDIVLNADFSPDSRRFVTTGIGGRVKMWNTRTGALLASLDIARGKDARFAPDNKRLVATRGDGRLQIWRFDTHPQPFVPNAGWQIVGVANNGTSVVLQSDNLDGRLDVRALATNDDLRPSIDVTAPFAIAEQSSYFAATQGAIVKVFDLAGATATRDITIARTPYELAISGNGERVAVMYSEAPPEIFDARTGALLVTLAGAQKAMLSTDGRLAIAWQDAGRPVIWNLDSKTAGVTLQSSPSKYRPIGFAVKNTRVALVETADSGRVVSLWSTIDGSRIAEHPSSTAPFFDPSGTFLTTIDIDHKVTVWNAEDGAFKASFYGDKLLQAQVNPQGTLVAAIAEYGTVAVLMDMKGRTLARWPLDHPPPSITQDDFSAPGGSATWTQNGASVITRSIDVGVWPVENRYTNEEIAKLVKYNVPWDVKNGQLVLPTNGRLYGTVTRQKVPQSGVKISVEIRTPAQVGIAPLAWESSRANVSIRTTETNERGEFEITRLLPGEYSLTVTTYLLSKPGTALESSMTIPAVVSVDGAAEDIELP